MFKNAWQIKALQEKVKKNFVEISYFPAYFLLQFHTFMVQWLQWLACKCNLILMEVFTWLTKLVPLASAAALAQMLAPSALSLRAMPSIRSTKTLASAAVPALIPAPTARLPRPNQSNKKTRLNWRVFCYPLRYYYDSTGLSVGGRPLLFL